ncbi:MAG TPA: hypothetical protein VK769_02105 [Verrucomicrobiae bacterium]|jgi:hypothetical protein|nr:hypothetical protein [Verrucomicrobiae bacterium]
MKTIFKWPNHFWFALALCAMIFSGCSCSAPKPTPDPLAGWKPDFHEQPNEAIEKDFQDYNQKEGLHSYPDDFLEDGTGQHAITFQVGVNGTWWRHILIYDKDNKRIKTIKYTDGHYAC